MLDPLALLALPTRLGARAVTNAWSATVALTSQIADRRAVAPVEHAQPGGLTVLPPDECLRLLGSRPVARLAYLARAGVPDVVPVNHAVHDGHLYVRSGPGPKLQAAERQDVVAVEADDVDEQGHGGWSVVAVGRARRLTAQEVAGLPPDALPQPWATGPRHAVIRVTPQRVHGRRLHASAYPASADASSSRR